MGKRNMVESEGILCSVRSNGQIMKTLRTKILIVAEARISIQNIRVEMALSCRNRSH